MFKQIMAFGFALVGAGLFAAQPVFADSTAASRAATTNAQVTLASGDLMIMQAPNIDFGSQAISATGDTYYAKTLGKTLTVINAGQDTDWSVQLTVAPFKSATGTLKGATLSLNDPTVSSSGDVISQAPTAKNVTIAADGSAKTLLSADRTTIDHSQYSTLGVGDWFSKYKAEDHDVSLYIPAGNVQGAYKSTLTWTLNNAPQ